jgi:hypothetical protein
MKMKISELPGSCDALFVLEFGVIDNVGVLKFGNGG